MRKLNVFNFVTLNGFYKGTNEDISWHRHGEEEFGYSAESLKSGNTLLFGRVTYEMMASFWPTPMGIEHSPIIAEGMNKAEKIVFSKKMKKAEWNNTKVIGGDIVAEMKRMKKSKGKDMTVLGSGSIVTQFTDAGLIDEYHIMIDPIAIGNGTTIFGSLRNKLELELTEVKTFKSGVVLLSYQPKD